MGGATEKQPYINAWQLVCCLIAAPIVYLFDQEFYEAVTLIFRGITYAISTPYQTATLGIVNRLFGDLDCEGLGPCLANLAYIFVIALPIVAVIVVVGLVLFVIALVILLLSYIPYWLATNPGPPRYLLDVFLVWFVAMFLYGVLFPIVWRLVEPLVAHTLGEIAFQRVRARVYGERPRLSQPLYLSVALLAFLGGGARVAGAALTQAAPAVAKGWHEVRRPVFEPKPPPEWPKVFEVPAQQTVKTGLMLREDEEVGFGTTAELTVIFGDIAVVRVGPSADSRYRQDCVVPCSGCGNCTIFGTGAPEPGELSLKAGAKSVKVTVYDPPKQMGRHWLTAGETYSPSKIWFDKDD